MVAQNMLLTCEGTLVFFLVVDLMYISCFFMVQNDMRSVYLILTSVYDGIKGGHGQEVRDPLWLHRWYKAGTKIRIFFPRIWEKKSDPAPDPTLIRNENKYIYIIF